MKSLMILTLALLTLNVFAGDKKETQKTLNEYANECRTTEVIVDEIVKNSHIKGHIKGLPVEAYDKFKVVFYVKTNRWYVHPYTYTEGQEAGYSYSNIDPEGNFWVRSLRRDVPAQKMAVVLVRNHTGFALNAFYSILCLASLVVYLRISVTTQLFKATGTSFSKTSSIS